MTTDTVTVACDQVAPGYRNLLRPGDWDLVTHVIRRDPQFKTEFAQELHTHRAQELADRVLAAAIQFIRYAGSTGGPTPPSARIDIGWHALILNTRVYRYVCQELLGYLLDHEPINTEGPMLGNRATPADTAAGMVVGSELNEPFDTLVGAAERDEVRVYLRQVGSLPRRTRGTRGGRGRGKLPQIAKCPTLVDEDRAPTDDLSLTDLLELAYLARARGSSKTVMVELRGFEPLTPSMRTR